MHLSIVLNQPYHEKCLVFSLHSLAISRTLCQHIARPHPNQGQLCGAGGHCGHQGHLPQVPKQVGSHVGMSVVICIFSVCFY